MFSFIVALLEDLCCVHWTSYSLCSCSRPVSLQSDWGRFLYGSKSLCELLHLNKITETVIISNIFSSELLWWLKRSQNLLPLPLNREGVPEYRVDAVVYKKLGNLSRFLLVPGQIIITINSAAGFTGQCDSGSWSKCHDWRLSHSHLAAASCTQTQIIH